MLCLSLAEGEISPYNLTTQQRMLMSSQTRLKNQRQVVYTGKGLSKVSSPILGDYLNSCWLIFDEKKILIPSVIL